MSYPKMKSPSMYLTNIDEKGCILVYKSSRQGYVQYLIGMFGILQISKATAYLTARFWLWHLTLQGLLHQIAKDNFDLELKLKILDTQTGITGKTGTTVRFRLDFDNTPYVSINRVIKYLKALRCTLRNTLECEVI